MIAIEIENTKQIMHHLLVAPTFDRFSFVGGALITNITYELDGHINKDFYTEEEKEKIPEGEECIPYSQIRPVLYNLMKGKRMPLSFKLSLQFPISQTKKLLSSSSSGDLVRALLLNVRFDGTKISITSGVNYGKFSLDKGPERLWDEYLEGCLKKLKSE